MPPPFEQTLFDAVRLLRELPHRREDVTQARGRFQRFRDAHPEVRMDLLVDQPPGTPYVDYDLLFGDPGGGTIALAWRADGGAPWTVEHADHWAANYVVTVDGRPLSIQQALVFLRFACRQQPEMMELLVEQQLVERAIEQDPPTPGDAEVDQAVRDFELLHGLSTPVERQRWLEEMGVTEARARSLVYSIVQRRKLKERVVGEIDGYFHAHRSDFDVVQVLRVSSTTEAVAVGLARRAREGLPAAVAALAAGLEANATEAHVEARYACELPSPLADASAGSVVGPIAEGSRWWAAHVIGRVPAELDERTRGAIRDRLFREWLNVQRGQATVRWHWL